MFAQVEFPPIENIVEWPSWFAEDTIFSFNKIAMIGFMTARENVIVFVTRPTFCAIISDAVGALST